MTLCPGYQQPSPFIRQLSLEPGGLRVGWRVSALSADQRAGRARKEAFLPLTGERARKPLAFMSLAGPHSAAGCPGGCLGPAPCSREGRPARSGWVWGTGSLAAPFGWESQGMRTRVGGCGCRGPSAPPQTCFLGLSRLQSWCCPPPSPEPRHHPGWVLQTTTICGAPSA